MEKKNLLYVSAYDSTFVNRDLDILESICNVRRIDVSERSNTWRFVKIFFRLWNGLIENDIVYCWFADVRAYIAVKLCTLFNKPSIVVIGGYELAWIPELNYGALRSKARINRVKYILKNATKVLFVDNSLKEDAEKLLGYSSGNFEVLATNFDPDLFPENGVKEKIILTVAVTESKRTAVIKGLPEFAQLSHQFSDWIFRIVGVNDEVKDWLETMGADNLQIIGKLDFSELLEEYRKARIYCQLSIREGLPNALCEAMLCGCIPVGTNVNGIPYAIGDSGYLCKPNRIIGYDGIVENDAKDDAEKKICLAIQTDPNNKARKRIIELFSIPKRARRIEQILEEIL